MKDFRDFRKTTTVRKGARSVQDLAATKTNEHTHVLEREELPDGFDHILITDDSREWWCGEGGGVNLSEIYSEIATKIASKNALVPRYRANLPAGAQLWLLLFSRVTVARSVPIPAGIEQWELPFDFDRVFWFASLENSVVEF